MDPIAAPMLNLLLRGGAIGLLVLMAATLWRDHPRQVAARLGAAFAIGIAAATLTSAPGWVAVPGAPQGVPTAIVAALAAGAMFVFWLFTRALFDDAFRLHAGHAVAWLALASAGAAHCLAPPPAGSAAAIALGLWLAAMPVLWALLAIVASLANWREDLVEGRRRLRTLVVAATAVYTLGQWLIALGFGLSLKAVVESSANAAGTAALTLLIAWWLLRDGSGGLFAPPAAPPETGAAAATTVSAAESLRESGDPPDPRQVAALEALMTVDRVYREPSLTIRALADRMALPEHKLRRLINQGLGHRNFSAFLNTYRLADAKRWLADREQADAPILTIAMDAGFQSLGPFNRAFKADTGLTPTEFRRSHAHGAGAESRSGLAESGIG